MAGFSRCTSEIHDQTKDIKFLKKPGNVNSLVLQFPDHEILASGSKTNSRGIAIFLKKNSEYKIKYWSVDQNCNLNLLDLQLGEIFLKLLNVYAPNPVFFLKIREYIEESTERYTLLCGDLNLVLNPKMDSHNYIHLNNPKSRSIILESMQTLNLSDIFKTVKSEC